jgi:hypothetical protein
VRKTGSSSLLPEGVRMGEPNIVSEEMGSGVSIMVVSSEDGVSGIVGSPWELFIRSCDSMGAVGLAWSPKRLEPREEDSGLEDIM